jgi:hypothetical protein
VHGLQVQAFDFVNSCLQLGHSSVAHFDPSHVQLLPHWQFMHLHPLLPIGHVDLGPAEHLHGSHLQFVQAHDGLFVSI